MTGHESALIAGTLHGLREWRVERGSTTLRGAAFDDAPGWSSHGEVTIAACRTATCPATAHEPPGHDCECGLHAYHPDRATARRAFLAAQMGKVVGIVEAWGRVEVHVCGFRAQFARPQALVRAPSGEARAEIAEIAAHHDAYVLEVEDGDEIYEHCLRHRFGIAEHVLEEFFGTAYWTAQLRDWTYWSGPPTWPPNMNSAVRCSMVLTPGELLCEFQRQRAASRRKTAAAHADLATPRAQASSRSPDVPITNAGKGDKLPTRVFTFLFDDRDNLLRRWDQWYVSDVWWPPRDGRPGQWSRSQVNPFTASVTAITRERAQEIVGPGADIYAEASAPAFASNAA